MIAVNRLNVSFGPRPLLIDVSFVVNQAERVALTGKNGAGKSTLLKILAGLQMPTEGEVAVPHGQTVGYLPQTMRLEDGRTVWEETATVFQDSQQLQKDIDSLTAQLAEREDYESADYLALIDRLTLLSQQQSAQCRQVAEMERTLIGLGFRREEFSRPTSELSGGWRMRIELAKILLRHPDVLLLDEPTNHLDILSIEWLEKFLKQSSCAVILVSHDRAFINRVTNRTMDIDCQHLIDYKVKYDEFLTLREERRASQLRAYENQQREIADIKAFVERFRYQATKAIQVQQRLRQLEKIVPIEVDEVDNSALHLKFPPCSRSGDFPIICEDVRKDYGEHCVFSHVNLSVRRGEKIAFVGRNGEGKSTLVKCIMQQTPHSGVLKIAQNVEIGYFAQNAAQLLDEDVSVFDTIDRVAKGEIRLKIRDILGAFMFGGEASEKKVKVLSGGERSRLAMIRLLLQPVNLLILDEPTNHLDLRTKDVLKEAIRNFDGTAIIVSHDRDFLDGLVSRVYEFADGGVREHIGGIYDFLRSIQTAEQVSLAAPKESPKQEAPSAAGISWQEQKEQRRKEQKLQKQIAEAERQIADLEAALRILEERLNTAEGAADAEVTARYARMSEQLDKAMEQWTEWSEALDEIRK